ncbi:MAG: hypothetical protein A2X86_16445 [Bdellovibrionales bacterium GWA2_49_15]|nr:MAG: hypothetical protein A2X86_16445 [Bdellovibrionales bacterium GWA2_49_15]HAZ13695.1 hypothetical protein [Bdellovibrionales bacterium]
MPIIISILLSLLVSRSMAQESKDCPFVLPSDLSNCGFQGQARLRYELLRTKVQSQFTQSETIDAQSMDEIISILNYLAPCEHQGCRHYDFNMEKPRDLGWKLAKGALITTTDGICAYNKVYLMADSHSTLDSSTHQAVLMIKKMPKKKHADEPFYSFPSSNIQCAGGEGRPAAQRSLIISYKGVYISDAPEVDPTLQSRAGTKRVNIKGGGRPILSFVSAEKIQLTWPNGAFIAVDNTGTIKDSNFLAPATYDSGQCQSSVTARGTSATPKVVLIPGQKLAY